MIIFPKEYFGGRLYRSPRAGNDPRKFVIIPPPLISRITCKKHNEQEFSQFRCVQSINPEFLPSGEIINLSEYKKWEYVSRSHRLPLDGHLVTELCITFITNDHSLGRDSPGIPGSPYVWTWPPFRSFAVDHGVSSGVGFA